MSAVVVSTARKLVRWKQEELGLKWLPARDRVATDAGLAPGTLQNLFRGKLKETGRIGRALDDLLITLAERKIAAIKHEMALALARGEADRPIDVDALEAGLAQARRALGKGADR